MGALCGVAGPEQVGLLRGMTRLLAHRARGSWEVVTTHSADQRVAIAHARAPLSQETQVARDGEQACLGYAGVLFPPPPSPQRLLATLRADPTHAESLDGAFVLAWQDGEAFHLLRDAAGVKAVYWAQVGRRLLFASEIKALFADPGLSKTLRPAALAEYFTFSFIPGANTMLEGVYELQPGTLLTWRDGEVTLRRWFTFEDTEKAEDVPAESHVARVREVLAQSTEACLAPHSNPGFFLSGGIDSSAVLAMAAHLRPTQTFPTFSVHFGPEYPHETDFINLMARHCRTDHHLLEVRPEQFTPRLEEICWRLDDPIGDPVAMPNYLLAEYAAGHTPLILNGEGGDPCFGGPKNIPMLLNTLYGNTAGESADGWLERQYLHAFQRAYGDLEQLLSPDIQHAIGDTDAGLVGLVRPFLQARQPTHFLDQLMAMNIRMKGANLILVKVDKMTSAHGLLALPPLFSRQIVTTSMAVPPELKLEGAVEKSVLKRAVADLVPRAIIDRPKSGMRVPVHYWFRGELRRYAQRRLSPRRLRRLGLFNPEYVRRIVRYDGDGVPGRRHGLKLWMLITFLLWYEQFFHEER